MVDIFNNNIALDCFCYDIVEAWIEHRKSKGKPLDKDSFMDWVADELTLSLEFGFDDCIVEDK